MREPVYTELFVHKTHVDELVRILRWNLQIYSQICPKEWDSFFQEYIEWNINLNDLSHLQLDGGGRVLDISDLRIMLWPDSLTPQKCQQTSSDLMYHNINDLVHYSQIYKLREYCQALVESAFAWEPQMPHLDPFRMTFIWQMFRRDFHRFFNNIFMYPEQYGIYFSLNPHKVNDLLLYTRFVPVLDERLEVDG